MSRTLQPIREAAIDGRLQNVIYRQNQLERLQKVLLDSLEPINAAIRKDSGHSDREAIVEYILTLQSVKNYYNTLNEADEIHREYAITRGKDAPERRHGVGVVYLVPTDHTPFYSVVVATCAAIAMGNCIVIELETTLKAIPALLRKLIRAALDPSIAEFVTSRASEEDLGRNYIRIYQEPRSMTEEMQPSLLSSNILISPPDARVVAVVDRTADLAKAATALVAARFLFGGNSRYCPDVVLVNEFVIRAFLIALVEQMVKLAANLDFAKAVDVDSTQKLQELLEAGKKNGQVEVVTSTSKSTVFELKLRDSELLRTKIVGRNLLVHSVRSLDDSIDLANRDSLLASYIFAEPKSAKYLSQFIKSHSSFVNQAPLDLLVGPPAPQFFPLNRSLRYPLELLSAPHPEYITCSPASTFVSEALCLPDSSAVTQELKLLSIALEPKSKRSAGGQVGFFEQGIFIGLSIYGVPAIMGLATLAYYGMRTGFRWKY